MNEPLMLTDPLTDPLVLLPGMMCDARLFGPQIKALGRDRAIHLPPMGQHDNVEQIATDVLHAAPKRFALAGLSFGGIVAMEVARRAPGRITRLALMDTNPLAETPQIAGSREPQIARVSAGALMEVMKDEMKPHYLAPGPRRQEVLDVVMEMARDQGEGVFIRQSRALQRRPDQQDTLRKLDVPTMVLCGEHDALCPVRRHEFMAELLPNAKLVVVPNAGHLPTLEQPDLVTEAMESWLER